MQFVSQKIVERKFGDIHKKRGEGEKSSGSNIQQHYRL